MIILIIGSHVSFSKDQLFGCVKESLSYNSNAFMFYTGAPTNTIRRTIDDDLTLKAHKLMKKNNINSTNVVVHAPYILNLANTSNLDKHLFSINFLKNEINRCQDLGISKIVIHPGNAVGITKEEGLTNIINALNQVVTIDTKVRILLETMAGKGTELGKTIEELKIILDGLIYKDKFGVCLDTCHLNDAGYDMHNFDNYLQEFDSIIGIDKIGCVHINDSKNDINTRKDRHANIGYGKLGFDAIINIIYNEKLKNVPKILETPYVGMTDDDKKRIYPPYKFEIEMIKNKEFDSQLLQKIREYYK